MFQVIYINSNKSNCINSDHLLLQVWVGRYSAYAIAYRCLEPTTLLNYINVKVEWVVLCTLADASHVIHRRQYCPGLDPADKQKTK